VRHGHEAERSKYIIASFCLMQNANEDESRLGFLVSALLLERTLASVLWSYCTVQGYLAHKKTHPLRTIPKAYA